MDFGTGHRLSFGNDIDALIVLLRGGEEREASAAMCRNSQRPLAGLQAGHATGD